VSNVTGTVRSVLGEVKVLRANGEEAILKEGDVISAGDTVKTGADATAYLEFPPTAEGQVAAEGILQPGSTAVLVASAEGAQLNVTEGEFELLSEGENQSVAVGGAASGGMMGLFGGSLLAGSTAAYIGAAAGAGLLLANNDDDDGTPTDTPNSGPAVPGPVQTVAEATGPAAPTVTTAYTDLNALTNATTLPVDALSPATDALEPVTAELAPVTDAAAPVLTPVNTVGTDALAGLSPVTTALDSNLTPVTSGLAAALSPATDVLAGTEGGMVSAAEDTLPVNLRVIAENLAMVIDQAAPPLADGIAQVLAALEPVLGPLNDGLTQAADALAPLFDALKQATDALPMATQPVADGLNQLFAALAPVLGPLADALNGGLPTGGDTGSTAGPTGTPLDMVLAPVVDATAGTPLEMVVDPIVSALATGADALGGGLPTGGDTGSTAGPTGTPLDMVLAPVADATAGTPLEMVTGPLLGAIETGAGALSGGLPTGGDSGSSSGPTGTPLDSALAMLDPSSLPISSSSLPPQLAGPLEPVLSQLPV